MPEKTIQIDGKAVRLTLLMKQAGLTASTSESLRMIDQGAVKVNGEKIEDKTSEIQSNETIVVQVGKRKFARITTA